MTNIINELNQIIDNTPTIRQAIYQLTQYIVEKYPMVIDGYDDIDNAKVTTHWQHILFDQLIFEPDYLSQTTADEIDMQSKMPIVQKLIQQPDIVWYTDDYQIVTPEILKHIIQIEFNQPLDNDDCLDDWDQVAITDTLNAELELN